LHTDHYTTEDETAEAACSECLLEGGTLD
jgi:hypothetical protein